MLQKHSAGFVSLFSRSCSYQCMSRKFYLQTERITLSLLSDMKFLPLTVYILTCRMPYFEAGSIFLDFVKGLIPYLHRLFHLSRFYDSKKKVTARLNSSEEMYCFSTSSYKIYNFRVATYFCFYGTQN